MKSGDAVIYVEKGVEYNALVQRAFALDGHTGQNDEPMLAVIFCPVPFKPEFRYDVHHESKDNAGSYWKELPSGEDDARVAFLRARVAELDKANAELSAQVVELKAKGDASKDASNEPAADTSNIAAPDAAKEN